MFSPVNNSTLDTNILIKGSVSFGYKNIEYVFFFFLSFRYCCDKLRLVPRILCWKHFVVDCHRLLSLHHLLRVQRWVLCTLKYIECLSLLKKKKKRQHCFKQTITQWQNKCDVATYGRGSFIGCSVYVVLPTTHFTCSSFISVGLYRAALFTVSAVCKPSSLVLPTALPFLKNTVVLLYPFALLGLIYVLSVSLGWNFTRGLCWFYKYRVQ